MEQLRIPSPTSHLDAFGASAMPLLVSYWINLASELLTLRPELVEGIACPLLY
jgi:hypothetical protein